MTQEQREEFAKLLVRYVRDKAVRSSDSQLYTDNPRAPIARRWREARESGNINSFAEAIIADCIDNAIGCFLLAIDEGVFNLSFKTSNGETIALDELAGEICGWYMGEWRGQYSSERAWISGGQ